MNLREFCEEYRISISKARKMDKEGVLRLDSGESEHGAEIRQHLSKGQPLTVAQLLEMIENPSILRDLGRYREKAESQLEALGDVRAEAAPGEVAAYITDAARRNEEAIGVLVEWLKSTIPFEPVTHHWIATRLLMGVPANIRKNDMPHILRALLNCRNSPDLKGWWRVETRRSRSVTCYQRPGKTFDL